MTELRPQCAGRLPIAQQATANGDFFILPTGTTDPEQSIAQTSLIRQATDCNWQLAQRTPVTKPPPMPSMPIATTS